MQKSIILGASFLLMLSIGACGAKQDAPLVVPSAPITSAVSESAVQPSRTADTPMLLSDTLGARFFDGKYQLRCLEYDFPPVDVEHYGFRYGLMDAEGKQIIPPIYARIRMPFVDRIVLDYGVLQGWDTSLAYLTDGAGTLLSNRFNGLNYFVGDDGSYIGVDWVSNGDYEILGDDGQPEPVGWYFVDCDGNRVSERYAEISSSKEFDAPYFSSEGFGADHVFWVRTQDGEEQMLTQAQALLRPASGDAAALDELYQTYIKPLGLTRTIGMPWASADEIDADSVMVVYMTRVYQDPLRGKAHRNSTDDSYHFPAADAENDAMQYFGMTPAQLQRSEFYHAAERTYVVPEGVGGAWSVRVTGASRDGGLLKINYDIFGGDDTLDAQGVMTVKLNDDDTYRYLSNEQQIKFW